MDYFFYIFIILLIALIFNLYDRKLRYQADKVLTYREVYIEFQNYTLSIMCKNILDRLLYSDNDANGSKLSLREISNPSEPFFNGLVALVVANMGDELKDRFFKFYKKTKNESNLILMVSSILEIYNMIMMERVKVYETEGTSLNKIAIQKNEKPVDVVQYTIGKLISSILNDLKLLNSLTYKNEE